MLIPMQKGQKPNLVLFSPTDIVQHYSATGIALSSTSNIGRAGANFRIFSISTLLFVLAGLAD